MLEINENLPEVTGSVKTDFKPIKTNKKTKTTTIGKFATKGEAVVLLENPELLSGYNYPHYINIEQEGMMDWVMTAPIPTKIRDSFIRTGKVPVGFEGRHSFGKPKNKWFTNTANKINIDMPNLFDISVNKVK